MFIAEKGEESSLVYLQQRREKSQAWCIYSREGRRVKLGVFTAEKGEESRCIYKSVQHICSETTQRLLCPSILLLVYFIVCFKYEGTMPNILIDDEYGPVEMSFSSNHYQQTRRKMPRKLAHP